VKITKETTLSELSKYIDNYTDKYNSFRKCHYLRIEHKNNCVKKECWDYGHETQINISGELYMTCKRILSKIMSYISGIRFGKKQSSLLNTKAKIIGKDEHAEKTIAISTQIAQIMIDEAKMGAVKKEIKRNIASLYAANQKGKKLKDEHKKLEIVSKQLADAYNKRKILAKERKELMQKHESKEENKELEEINRALEMLEKDKKLAIEMVDNINKLFESDLLFEEDLEKLDTIRKIHDKLYKIKMYAPSGYKLSRSNESLLVSEIFSSAADHTGVFRDDQNIETYILPLFTKQMKIKAKEKGYDFIFPYLLSVNKRRFSIEKLNNIYTRILKDSKIWGIMED